MNDKGMLSDSFIILSAAGRPPGACQLPVRGGLPEAERITKGLSGRRILPSESYRDGYMVEFLSGMLRWKQVAEKKGRGNHSYYRLAIGGRVAKSILGLYAEGGI